MPIKGVGDGVSHRVRSMKEVTDNYRAKRFDYLVDEKSVMLSFYLEHLPDSVLLTHVVLSKVVYMPFTRLESRCYTKHSLPL